MFKGKIPLEFCRCLQKLKTVVLIPAGQAKNYKIPRRKKTIPTKIVPHFKEQQKQNLFSWTIMLLPSSVPASSQA
jgi:hypothetical protein